MKIYANATSAKLDEHLVALGRTEVGRTKLKCSLEQIEQTLSTSHYTHFNPGMPLRPPILTSNGATYLHEIAERTIQLAAKTLHHAADLEGGLAQLANLWGWQSWFKAAVQVSRSSMDLALRVARPDCVISGGTVHVIELNVDCAIGFGDVTLGAPAYLQSEALAEARRNLSLFSIDPTSAFAAFLRAVLQERGKPHGLVALIDDASETKTRIEQAAFLSSLGVDCIFVPHDAFGRDSTNVGERPIELVLKCLDLDVTIPDSWLPALGNLLPMFSSELPRVVSNGFSTMLSDKRSLWALHRFKHTLKSSDRAFIEQHVPETYHLGENEVEHDGMRVPLRRLLEDRQNWILKPAFGFGGRNTTLGVTATDQAWEAAVRGALGDARMVAQAYKAPDSQALPFLGADGTVEMRHCVPVVGPYVIGSSPAGVFIRALHGEHAVINASRGALALPALISAEDET